VDNLLKDLRYGIRALVRSPGFTVVAAASLGLGIGVNTAIFSLVDAILLRPLPVSHPEELVTVYTGRKDFPYSTVSYPDYLDFRDQASVFSGLAAHSMMTVSLRGDRESELVRGEVVSGNYFDVLGVKPFLGRLLSPEDDRAPGAHAVVVLSHGFWSRRYGADPAILGKTLKLNGTPLTVVEVAAESFTGTIPGLSPELWIPLMMENGVSVMGMQEIAPSPGETRLERRGQRWLLVKGRLRRGRSAAEAQANLDAIAGRLGQDYPDTNAGRSLSVYPAHAVRIHPMADGVLTPSAAALMAVVGAVLLIACANVASMMLARATARQREIAVRLAMGASRLRLVRQLLTEGLLLSGLGGAVGLLLGLWATEALAAFKLPIPIPLALDLGIDGRVLLFTALISLASGLIFALAPALRATRPDLVPALKDETALAGFGRRRFGVREFLVIGQVAVSLVLLVGASLLVRGLIAARSVELGFDPARLATLEVNLKFNDYSPERAQTFFREAVERLEGLPSVESASVARRLPLSPDINIEGIFVPGHQTSPDEPGIGIDAVAVGPAYFKTLGVPLLEGRDFNVLDTAESPRVAIVNQAFGHRFWPAESALGKRFHLDSLSGPPVEIVGVVSDHKVRTVGETPRPYLHFALSQDDSLATNFLVRTRGEPGSELETLRRELLQLEPDLVFSSAETLPQTVSASLFPVRMGSALLASAGGLAVLMAAIGLYGAIAYWVSCRTREMGIRVALGAGRGEVLKLVVGQGMILAVLGGALGVVGAAAGSRILSGLLYGVSALDPTAFAAALGLILGVSFIASYAPARRAAALDPMAALRQPSAGQPSGSVFSS
jgi:predicted permease